MTKSRDALTEWRSFWYLPVAASLGYATAVMYVYSMGAYIDPIQQEFGWSRAQVSSGITMAAFLSALFCIPMGILVDRIGPRRVGLTGVLLMCCCVALLGTATGSQANWVFLWCLLAFSTLFVQATVWTSAVNSRFEASRGLALAITLSGASVAATIFPILATWLTEKYDWRTSYMAMAGIWALITLPFMFFCFRGAQDRKIDKTSKADKISLNGISIAQGIRSPALYKLLVAAGFFAFTAIGIVVHFVPILKDSGADPLAAAGVASLIGVFSIVGRLGTGYLLDKFPGHLVGAVAFVTPILACLLLIHDGSNPISQAVAAAIFGLTLGSEVDVIAYLSAKHFGLKNFGALYGAVVMALSLGTAFGPLGAGAIYDHYGSYSPFLIITAIMMGASAISLFSLNPVSITEDVATQHI